MENEREADVTPRSNKKGNSGSKVSNPASAEGQRARTASGKSFAPNCITLRASQFFTISDILSFWENQAVTEGKYSFVLDDRTFEEDCSSSTSSHIVDLAVGLNCEYLVCKGYRKIERYAKLTHYLNNFC